MSNFFKFCQYISKFFGSKRDQKIDIIVRCRATTVYLTAFFAFVGDDKALFGVGLAFYGLKSAVALAGAVSGIDIQMQ